MKREKKPKERIQWEGSQSRKLKIEEKEIKCLSDDDDVGSPLVKYAFILCVCVRNAMNLKVKKNRVNARLKLRWQLNVIYT